MLTMIPWGLIIVDLRDFIWTNFNLLVLKMFLVI